MKIPSCMMPLPKENHWCACTLSCFLLLFFYPWAHSTFFLNQSRTVLSIVFRIDLLFDFFTIENFKHLQKDTEKNNEPQYKLSPSFNNFHFLDKIIAPIPFQPSDIILLHLYVYISGRWGFFSLFFYMYNIATIPLSYLKSNNSLKLSNSQSVLFKKQLFIVLLICDHCRKIRKYTRKTSHL